MAAPTSKSVELTLPSELGNEKLAIALAEALANRMGFSADRVADLRTAVAEACINAIEHGNRLDSSVKVLVQLTEEPNRLSVDVVDRCADPIQAPAGPPCIRRMLDGEVPSGGLGIFLIRSLTDEVEIRRQPGGNQVRMVFHLQTANSLGDGRKG